MNVPSAHRISGLVLAACLSMLVVASGSGAVVTQSLLRVSAKGEDEPTFTISGYKWHDLNADRNQDADEEGLNGWTIFIDDDDDGEFDAVEIHTETAKSGPEDGYYEFSGLESGEYKICEVLEYGWLQSYPDPDVDEGCHNITLGDPDVDNLNFGNYQKATKSGYMWHDLNADGMKDDGEPYVSGKTINLCTDTGTGLDIVGTTTTDANGYYKFVELMPGVDYFVSEVIPGGWSQSYPNQGNVDAGEAQFIADVGYVWGPVNLDSQEVESDNDFGNWTTATITGTKWEDKDADSERDAWDPGLAGWTIEVYDSLDGGALLASKKTEPDGSYEFTLDPGDYTVCEVLEDGWSQSYPDDDGCHHNITLVSEGVEQDKDFGNCRIRQITVSGEGVTNANPSISGDGEWVAFVSDVDLHPEIYRVHVPSRVRQRVTISLPTVTNEVPSTNGNGTVIAFVSDGNPDPPGTNADGNQEIFVAERGTTAWEITAITDTPGSIFPGFNLDPSIDDEGLHIAFASDYDLQEDHPNDDGNLEIFVATRENDPPSSIQATDSISCTNAQPSLSGNGQYVAFVSTCDLDPGRSNDDGSPEIFVARLDGSGAIAQLTDSGLGVTNAHPSIDTLGKRIAFVSDVDGNPEVFVAALDPGSMEVGPRVQVTKTGEEVGNAHPSISGSGQYVAFVSDGDLLPDGSNDDYNPEIFVAELELDSLNVVAITQVTYSDADVTNAQPSISILGGRVAFISDGDLDPKTENQDGNPEVFVATFATGNDIVVQKIASVNLVRAGEPIIYTITVQNHLGPNIPSIVLTDTLTSSVPVVKGDLLPTQGSCGSWSDSTVTCTLGEIETGDVITLTLVITPSQAGVITNTALVSTLGDPFPGSNEDTVVLGPPLYLPLILRGQ